MGLVADFSTTEMGDHCIDQHVLFGFYHRVDVAAVHGIYANGLLLYGWSKKAPDECKRLGLAHSVASWIKMSTMEPVVEDWLLVPCLSVLRIPIAHLPPPVHRFSITPNRYGDLAHGLDGAAARWRFASGPLRRWSKTPTLKRDRYGTGRSHLRFPAPFGMNDLGTSCHWPAVARVVVTDGAKQHILLEERGAHRCRFPKTRSEEGSRNRHRSMARGECYRDGTAMMKKCCGRFS
jgi:hypothetical protein